MINDVQDEDNAKKDKKHKKAKKGKTKKEEELKAKAVPEKEEHSSLIEPIQDKPAAVPPPLPSFEFLGIVALAGMFPVFQYSSFHCSSRQIHLAPTQKKQLLKFANMVCV